MTTIYEKAIATWGKDSQLLQTTEECAELIKAITKHLNRGESPNNIIEEAVDVEMMLNQLKAMFPSVLWKIVQQEKMTRLKHLLQKTTNDKR